VSSFALQLGANTFDQRRTVVMTAVSMAYLTTHHVHGSFVPWLLLFSRIERRLRNAATGAAVSQLRRFRAADAALRRRFPLERN